MVESVIFDMDGTLFQTDRILEMSLEDAFDALRMSGEWNEETPVPQYRAIMGAPLPKVWETLLPDHSPAVRERTDAYFQEKLILHIREGRGALYPNVKPVFDYLRESGISIYIASNGLPDYLQAIVSYYRLDHWVAETCSIQHIHSLNKSDLVKSILEKHQIKKAAVVGDRLSDFRAAKDNGLAAIGCHFDFARKEELAYADFVIHDLLELVTIVPQLKD